MSSITARILTPLDPIKSPLDPIKSPLDPINSPLDPIKSPFNPIKSPVHQRQIKGWWSAPEGAPSIHGSGNLWPILVLPRAHGPAVHICSCGYPKSWMVYFMENPSINGWFRNLGVLLWLGKPPFGDGSKACTPVVNIKIAGLKWMFIPLKNGMYRYWSIAIWWFLWWGYDGDRILWVLWRVLVRCRLRTSLIWCLKNLDRFHSF